MLGMIVDVDTEPAAGRFFGLGVQSDQLWFSEPAAGEMAGQLVESDAVLAIAPLTDGWQGHRLISATGFLLLGRGQNGVLPPYVLTIAQPVSSPSQQARFAGCATPLQ